MENQAPQSLIEHFSVLDDPRIDRTKLHKLIDILVIAICATICGAEGWEDFELFGHCKLDWFKSFLELPNGIPSHDTFRSVLARLDPQQFQAAFLDWVRSVTRLTRSEGVASAGKQLRRSHDQAAGKSAIQMVRAWAEENRLVLGEAKIAEKPSETAAIRQLLRWLEIRGCIGTSDALGCQTEIAAAIREPQADDVLAVKGNQPHLVEDVVKYFDWALEEKFKQSE